MTDKIKLVMCESCKLVQSFSEGCSKCGNGKFTGLINDKEYQIEIFNLKAELDIVKSLARSAEQRGYQRALEDVKTELGKEYDTDVTNVNTLRVQTILKIINNLKTKKEG